MESLKPLHKSTLQKWPAFINRSHTILHILALVPLFYYRTLTKHEVPKLPFTIILTSELLFSFIWLLKAAYGWRPISRTVYPERLFSDETKLPSIDVFICTADPEKEPVLDVMNTVLSAMALDYPPEKLSVYLSDDGGSDLTLLAMREAWNFAERSWVPFCRKFGIKNRCPKAFFGSDDVGFLDFHEEKDRMEKEYSKFMEVLKVATEEERKKKGRANYGRQHPSNIQIIGNKGGSYFSEMPFLVYVSREKAPNYPHNFKAGALNCLLRVSSCMSNAPYILVQDCDMYSNDPSSARQAMCFHLDQSMAPSLSFVQFPQKFHNINKNDIYGGALRFLFVVKWPGLDGLRGPILSGTGFYIKRKSLYCPCGSNDEDDLTMLKESFGTSNELIKSLSSVVKGDLPDDILFEETNLLASCSYEEDTQWGKQIGFLYNSVCEDFFTGFILHCRGWKSVYCNPSRPAFLGTAPTNLGDTLVQGTRWNSGLLEVSLSRFCPIIYGFKRLPLLDCMTYAYLSLQPLYCIPIWCLAVMPQLCLLGGIPIFPKVSSPWFILFSFVFASPLVKDLFDILCTGGNIQIWFNEWRIWMIKSVTCYSYGCLDAFLKMVGLREANFLPTNKVEDDEQVNRYKMGLFDFQAPLLFIAPLVSLILLNMASFLFGMVQVILGGFLWEDMFGQMFISFFILIVNYPIIEGMVLRKDKGCIPTHATLVSAALVLALISLSSISGQIAL